MASLVLLSATTWALIVPTDLPMLLPDKPLALADRAGTCRWMVSVPVCSWHSCADLVVVTELRPGLNDCTRPLLWSDTELRHFGPENKRSGKNGDNEEKKASWLAFRSALKRNRRAVGEGSVGA